jgi:hypothetical protein
MVPTGLANGANWRAVVGTRVGDGTGEAVGFGASCETDGVAEAGAMEAPAATLGWAVGGAENVGLPREGEHPRVLPTSRPAIRRPNVLPDIAAGANNIRDGIRGHG